jgi:hypothetical protein
MTVTTLTSTNLHDELGGRAPRFSIAGYSELVLSVG